MNALPAPPGRGAASNGAILAARPMGLPQMLAVAVAVALNALDGFDVLAITFAAPVIARAWQIGPTALGAAISAGLVGMTLGSLLLAPLGDAMGRRPLVLICVAIMGAGMLLTATATSLTPLCVWRLVTGVGIGGMLAAINAVAAEFANDRRRDLCIALMTVGYPVGGLIGGFVSASLVGNGWQMIFMVGGVLTLAFLPVVWALMPESIVLLEQRGRAGDGERVGRLMRRMGHAPVAITPANAQRSAHGALRALFVDQQRILTIALVLGYFLHIVTFYFFSGWLPKLMTDLGHAAPDAIRTSALMSVGGVLGGALFGWVAGRVGLRLLLPLTMAGASLMLALFAQLHGLLELQVAAVFVGVFVFGGIVGLYAMLARGFPPHLRVTGAGLVVGVGRGGAIIGPVLGGFLLERGVSLAACITVVGLCSLGAAVAVRFALGRVHDTNPAP